MRIRFGHGCMNGLLSVVILAASVLPASAESITWDWLSQNFAPCEGVGIHGTYRVYVRAEIRDVGKQGKKVTALAVHAGSAALLHNKGDLSGKITIEKNGAILATARLMRQSPNSIAEAPKADETERMFIPDGKDLDVPPGAMVRIEVSLAIKTDTGACSLGSTSNLHDLFK